MLNDQLTNGNSPKQVRPTPRKNKAAYPMPGNKNADAGEPCTSRFVGVYWEEKRQRWTARAMIAGENVFCGRHTDEKTAARFRDRAVRKHLGKAGFYNFPHKGERAATLPEPGRVAPVAARPVRPMLSIGGTGAMQEGVRERPGNHFVVSIRLHYLAAYIGTFPSRDAADAALEQAQRVRGLRRIDGTPITIEALRGLPEGPDAKALVNPGRAFERMLLPGKEDAAPGERAQRTPRARRPYPKGRRWMLRKARQYADHLRAAGRVDGHVASVRKVLRRMVVWGRVTGKAKLTGENVMRVIDRLRKRGYSLRTCNAHIIVVKAFGRWLYQNGHYERRPLEFLKKFRDDVDPRHERRAFTPKEFARLLDATRASPWMFWGMTPDDRAALYVLAVSTGLRQGTLRALTVSQFDLDGPTPLIRIHARQMKGRKARVLPLNPDLTPILREYLAGKPPAAKALIMPKMTGDTVRAFRRDLHAAGLEYCVQSVTEDGKAVRREDVLDFHALRHSFISWLVKANVSPAIVQRLAGHASVTTTLKHYTHLNQADEVAALGKLPNLPGRAA
jgi:integrase